MGKETEKIKQYFPGLKYDKNFKVTSKATSDYNCIAWALQYTDRFMWPNSEATAGLDGVYYWPDGIEKNEDISAFVEAFRQKGYEICTNGDFEEGYRKIALYVKPGTTECTHAARQLRNGFWTSKLGSLEDIQHGTAFTIQGVAYGVLGCFMKKAVDYT